MNEQRNQRRRELARVKRAAFLARLDGLACRQTERIAKREATREYHRVYTRQWLAEMKGVA